MALTPPPQSLPIGWILQGNPEKYDIDAYFTNQTYVYWNFNRFPESVQIGQPVFFKRSGSNGGLIAFGTIRELPTSPSDVEFPELLSPELWVVQQANDTPKVGVEISDLRLTEDEGMIPTQALSKLPQLENHPIVKAPLGTVFRLSADQFAELFQLWGGSSGPHAQLIPYGETEGGRSLQTHRRIERRPGLRKAKLAAVLSAVGSLSCEACGRDYEDQIPEELRDRIFEVHHSYPLSAFDTPRRVTIDELAVLCATCHRAVHATADVEANLEAIRILCRRST